MQKDNVARGAPRDFYGTPDWFVVFTAVAPLRPFWLVSWIIVVNSFRCFTGGGDSSPRILEIF